MVNGIVYTKDEVSDRLLGAMGDFKIDRLPFDNKDLLDGPSDEERSRMKKSHHYLEI